MTLDGQKKEPARTWDPTSSTTRTIILCVALGAVLATFLPTLTYSFVNWDDDLHVYENPAVVSPDEATWKDRLLTPTLGYPMPVVVGLYRMEHGLFGLNPLVYHLTNVAIHVLNVLLLFLFARRMGLGFTGALVASLLFGLHPVVAEPVSWISGRKDLLSFFFSLVTLLLYAERPLRMRDRKSWLVVLTFALAAFSKPVALCVPLLCVAVAVFHRKSSYRGALLSIAPLAIVAAVVFLLAMTGQREVGAVPSPGSMAGYFRNIYYSLGFHLDLALGIKLPLAKHIPLSMPPRFDPRVDLAPVVFALVLAAAVRFLKGKWRRLASFGLVFAGVCYLPNSSIIPLIRFLADSYLYFAMAGLGIFTAALLMGAGEELFSSLVVSRVASAALLILLAVRTLNASASWEDGISLWRSVYSEYPDSPQVCRSLGNAYNEQSRHIEALKIYQHCKRTLGSEIFDRNIAITKHLIAQRRGQDAASD